MLSAVYSILPSLCFDKKHRTSPRAECFSWPILAITSSERNIDRITRSSSEYLRATILSLAMDLFFSRKCCFETRYRFLPSRKESQLLEVVPWPTMLRTDSGHGKKFFSRQLSRQTWFLFLGQNEYSVNNLFRNLHDPCGEFMGLQRSFLSFH